MFVKIFSMDSENFFACPRENLTVTVVFVKGGRTPMHQSENAMALIARDAFDYFQNVRTD
jgi:hypothetical protein